ncbi:PTS fructose transporter subunit IIA [Miniphocaeibacter massiliensis]|uniref:PTS sugar transporter subunit IIA domain-containing protein n=1 Tax=Miniphocaeibacter massiliensis TaxID=2041841 RepID=UPI000C1C4DCA|nr:PTS fructose transporter subunit IIA [Miniphocaeibacter massiliensis]
MTGVIFSAHGNFASGLYSGLKLIAGEMENIKIVDFLEGDGNDGLDKKLSEALESLKSYNNIIILTDLAGGTPFNRSVLLTQDIKNVRVLSGTNFQMLYTAAFDPTDDINELTKNIIDAGKEGISLFELKESSSDNSDDGI